MIYVCATLIIHVLKKGQVDIRFQTRKHYNAKQELSSLNKTIHKVWPENKTEWWKQERKKKTMGVGYI